MRGFLAVARREIVEKRFVLVAAAIASLIPLLAPLAPAIRSFPADEARDLTAFFFAACFAIVLSLLLGATTIGRDLSERRLGFYFSKPIGSLSIAMGKILASAVLALGGGLIVITPATIASGGIRRLVRIELPVFRVGDLLKPTLRPVILLAAAGFVTLALVALAHCWGVILRSRSAWLTLDVVALALAVFLFLSAVGQLSFLRVAWTGPGWWAFLTVWSFLISFPALIAASLFQISLGRADLRRGHKALSITLSSFLILLAAGFLSGSAWYANPSPHELAYVASAVPSPKGDWIAVSGIARHRRLYQPAFLYNVSTGAFRRLRTSFSWFTQFDGLPVKYSRNGDRAAWLEGRRADKDVLFEIVTARLDGAISREQRWRWQCHNPPEFFLSPEGARLASIAEGLLSVVELTSERSLASVRLPPQGEDAWIGLFVREDEIRLVRRGYTGHAGPPWSVLTMFTLDIASKKLEQTGEIEIVSGEPQLILSPTGERLIVDESIFGRLTLCDARSAAILAKIGRTLGSDFKVGFPDLRRSNFQARFLADGRFVVAECAEGRGRLRLLSANGTVENTIDLGAAKRLVLGGPPSEQTLLVCLGAPEKETWNESDWRLVKVDLTDGHLHVVNRGLVFPLSFGFYERLFSSCDGCERTDVWRPGSTASRLVFDAKHGSLVELDPSTGQRRVILGGH